MTQNTFHTTRPLNPKIMGATTHFESTKKIRVLKHPVTDQGGSGRSLEAPLLQFVFLISNENEIIWSQ